MGDFGGLVGDGARGTELVGERWRKCSDGFKRYWGWEERRAHVDVRSWVGWEVVKDLELAYGWR